MKGVDVEKFQPGASLLSINMDSPLKSNISFEDSNEPISNHKGLVQTLLEGRARLCPDSIALQFDLHTTMTYRELNEKSNAVARQLVCGRGAFVPIAIQRSPELVVALLAVMKAGAAYVLLSPDAPDDRNNYIIQDLGASFVITDDSTFGRFQGIKQIPIRDLLDRADGTDPWHLSNLNVFMDPSEYAYVVYTSGTTGNPKGVLLSHGAAYRGLSALPRPESAQSLRQLLCHSPNFSAAQRTILGTLVRGGTLCLASKEDLTMQLHQTIIEMRVSSLEITPSMLKLIDPASVPESIKKITLGGEMVSPALVDLWGDRVELTSAYGLSECTQLNMRHRLHPGHSHRLIGKPEDATTAFVLSPGSTSPVPQGMPGELCLAGPQLADGYLNLREKTDSVFVNNPFATGRLYRTGDMVISLAEGTFELVGRIDQQTKIDGQRVEPNESNSILETCEGVRMSSVVAAHVLNRNALVAVVVPENGQEFSLLVRELRQKLAAKLPSYSVPAFWIERQKLPTNVSGKVDIAALVKDVESLPEEELVSRSSTPKATPPRTPPAVNANDFFEAVVAKAVAEVLSISLATVDVELSFQELGGSSLNAIVLASKLRKINIHIAVPDILTSSSLREMTSRGTATSALSFGPPAPFSLLPESVRLNRAGLEDAYPVTPLQEGIIADSVLGRASYVYQRVYKIQNVLPQQVKSALQAVVSRNAILRSSFKPFKRTFLQTVKPYVSLPWKDLSHKSLESYRNTTSADMAIDGPLVRATLLQDSLLLVEMHHGLFDFWSSQFIFNDANAILQGQTPANRASFNNYVAYQQTQHNEDAKAFWREYLENPTPSRLQNPNGEVSQTRQKIEMELKQSPMAFCGAHNITLGTLVHAVWAMTLSKQLKTSDVVFLAAFSGRDAAVDGILALNGPTLCTVPMRIRIDGKAKVVDFVKDVQENLWQLSRYAHSGLRNVMTASNIGGDIFNTMVNVLVSQQTFPEDAPLRPIETHADNYTQYPTIEVVEQDSTKVKFLCQASLNAEMEQSVLADFVQIMDSITQDSSATVADSLAGPVFIPDSPEPGAFGLAHAAFEGRAKINPSKLAVRTSTGLKLSYGELNAKANSFAHYLSQNGSIHDEMIPLYMEKSAMTLVSILGILKAGASFTPLDPKNPHERNSFIIKDVEAKRVIADQKNLAAASAFGVEVVVPEEFDFDSNTDEPPSVPELTPESVIYAIYTSGSTGLPKGVLVQHAAVTASTEGMIEATAVTSEWNALWVLNYVFDASYYDVFTLFSAGATICLAPQDEVLSNLAGLINSMNIEQVMLTPTITKLINGGPAQVPNLKVLNVCGERIDANILKWSESVDVYNGYGPTEATILMTVSKVQPNGSLNSIGFPLKHAVATILPAEGTGLEPVPRDQIGELCVAGAHLAKGYLNRPEQTAKSFISSKDGTPLYRTGDLARWNDDGTLECFGRKDYQVKLNGFRIELGEIENAIIRTEDVEACVVSVAELQSKRQLVAFCIFKGDEQYKSEGLLPPADRLEKVAALMSKLTTISHYMMPALFLPFGRFSTLPSGKTNRKELVVLVEKMEKSDIVRYLPSDESSGDFMPVSTDEERIMQQAWTAVLGEDEESIGASSSFLSFGGDSISAINLVAECRKLSYTISVADVLANGTLSEQAKHLISASNNAPIKEIEYDIPESVYSALSHANIDVEQAIEAIYPAGPGQIEFLIQGHKQHQFWNLTACRELPPNFDLHRWFVTTKELTARYQILRTMYHQADPSDATSWYQIILKENTMNWEQIFYSTPEEKTRFMHELRDSTFAFGTPAIKYRLLESLVDNSQTLCIKVDHGSYDGTLLRIFDEQFTAIIRGDDPLPDIEPFKPFVDWAHRADQPAALDYWTTAIGDYTPTHNLPLEPVTDALKFAPVHTDVDALAARFGVTASTVFQAAYAIVGAVLTGSSDVLVDNLMTGRNADVADPQRVSGTCANFLPFRSQLAAGEQSVARYLSETQARFWETTERAVVGLTDIYRALGRERLVHGAKLLFCFQPFEPAPAGAQANHMRWIVMAQSKVFMTINYAVMVEVQKTLTGHRFKLQWDSRALDGSQADATLALFDRVLAAFQTEESIGVLLRFESELRGLWKE
ncbi:MAG: NRPS [Bathelium mastoideum]|nr:MAG: NRPS [Bathelium mastoideum]